MPDERMRGNRGGGSTEQGRALPTVRAPLASSTRSQQHTHIQGSSAHKITSGGEAIARALKPVSWGEGARIGAIGQTGSGKTVVVREIVREYVRRRPRALVLICDFKGECGFEGFQCSSVEALTAHADQIPQGARVFIFRDGADPVQTMEAVAALALQRAQRAGSETLVVFDEAAELAQGAGFHPGAHCVKRLFTAGRSDRISVMWGTQRPQDVQGAMLSETAFVFAWKVTGHALKNLRNKDFLSGVGVEETLAALPGNMVPPKERGAFLLLSAGMDWDKRVYRL